MLFSFSFSLLKVKKTTYIKIVKTFLSLVNFLFYVYCFLLGIIKSTPSGLIAYTLFFVSSARLKLAKNQAKAKQHSDAELLLLGNYSVSLSALSSKTCAKKVSV